MVLKKKPQKIFAEALAPSDFKGIGFNILFSFTVVTYESLVLPSLALSLRVSCLKKKLLKMWQRSVTADAALWRRYLVYSDKST